MKIAAGIILYHPDIERLNENISSIYPQVDHLFLVNNGSQGINIEKYPNITWINNSTNKGVAFGLNQILNQCYEQGYDWVITLDQDSVCAAGMVEEMKKNIDTNIGIICPIIEDRNYGIKENIPTSTTSFINESITSASLTNVKIWKKIGGFDEYLFIDGVDTDYCLTLIENGFKILQINNLILKHEIGHKAKIIHLFGRKYVVFNHCSSRYYYIARNYIYISRKHSSYLQPYPFRCLLTISIRLMLILCFEKNKLQKTIKILSGIKDGLIEKK